MALAAGLHLGWIEKSQGNFKAFPVLKGGSGVAGLVIAIFLILNTALRGPGVTWQPYTEEALKDALNNKKPVIIDFYATWCTPCREIEEITFHQPDVVQLAEKNFTMVKVAIPDNSTGEPFFIRLTYRNPGSRLEY